VKKKLHRLGRLNSLDPYYQDDLPVNEYVDPTNNKSLSRVYVWGSAVHGALGNPTFVFGKYADKKMKKFIEPKDSFYNPVRCGGAEQYRIKDAAAGYGFTVYATGSDSYILGTGLNRDGQIGQHTVKGKPVDVIVAVVKIPLPPDNGGAVRVEAGRSHTLVLTKTDKVLTLGNNAYGQCGRKSIPDEDYFKSNIIHAVTFPELSSGDRIVDICAGIDHSLFLSQSGQVFSCGWSADGQTGLESYNNQDIPTRVRGEIENEVITKVACSGDCVLALNEKGEVFGWGNSEYGQFNAVTPEQQLARPTRLKHVEEAVGGKVIDIAAGASICMVLNENRDVFVWGFGILGKGPKLEHSYKPVLIPQVLFGKNEFSPDVYPDKIYCGLNSNGVLNSNGELFTWGKNRNAALGLGNKDDQFFPLRVSCISRMNKISFGVDHSVALSDDVI